MAAQMYRWIARFATCLCLHAGAVDLQGHRGARGLLPENTIASFEKALALGATTLETDVAVTRDGVLVLHHDQDLNPDITRDDMGQWLEKRGPLIHALTLDELRRYDVGRIKAGTQYARNFAQQEPRDGSRIPTLAELFALVKRPGNERVRLALETKVTPIDPGNTLAPEEFARRLVAEVRKAGLEKRTSILSFDWRSLREVQRIAPEIATTYITARQSWLDNVKSEDPGGSPWVAGFQYRTHGSVPHMIHAAGGRTWSAHFRDLDTAQVEEARKLGLTVLAWTVNRPADIEGVLDLGVDGIVTDRPDLVMEALRRRGIAPK